MQTVHTVVNANAVNTNAAQVLNQNYGIDLNEFERITGAEVVVSDNPTGYIHDELRILQEQAKGKGDAYYNVRAQFLSDGSGPAKSVEFASLIGVPVMSDIASQLDALAAEYGRYVEDLNVAEARSNTFLFGILAKCYDKYALLMRQTDQEQAKIVNRIDAYMLDKNIATTGKTYTLSKLLMCVFVGADAKKINSYYSAIQYAQKQGLKPEGFVQYVQDFEGGLTAMRLANAASKNSGNVAKPVLSRDEKLVKAIEQAQSKQLAVFESGEVAQNVDATAGQIVLIATPLSGGKYAINAALSERAVVDAALLALYKKNKEAIANEQKAQEQIQDADQIDQLAEQAAALAS